MNREEKAFKRMFGASTKPREQRPHFKTRSMSVTLASGTCELLWQNKYGVWFLMAVSKGFSSHFRHAPITGKAFKLWSERTGNPYHWLPAQTTKNLQFFND